MPNLFSGPTDLTVHGERLAFVLTLLFALPIAATIGYVIHEEIGFSQVALLFIVAMVYVTLARGRLLGSSVRIHETQYPRVFSIVRRAAAALDLPMPLVFVREDYQVPVVAIGLGQPYSLVLSSHWIDELQDDELTFLIGRELGHIASGHTRFTSLLSANGNENPLISLIFGAWLRRAELTCDRIGLLCCGSIDVATRAIAVASFHHFGRTIDYSAFLEQGREIEQDNILRLGEWLSATPFATRRMAALRSFIRTQLYSIHEEHFVQAAAEEPVPLRGGEHVVQRNDCAGWWRRFWALAIDFIVMLAVIQTLFGGHSGASSFVNVAPTTATAHNHVTVINPDSIPLSVIELAGWTIFPTVTLAYFVLLVTVAGQTPGMMITGLRVVRTDFRKPGFWQTVWRYIVAVFLAPISLIMSPFTRLLLHDRWSGTRLIKSERLLARTSPIRA
ncbi:MAG: RDD family protein [Candidatus Eremiobacteraeota bacterium]|nr:RDD family protein [Candidatus Eremiobacteraeota bacterium]